VKKLLRTMLWGAVAAFGLLLPAAWLLPGGLELRITPVEKADPLLVLPLDPGEPFTLHYMHSVENAPIWETHSLDEKGRIYIEEERYLKFGAGMGRMPGVGRMVRRGPMRSSKICICPRAILCCASAVPAWTIPLYGAVWRPTSPVWPPMQPFSSAPGR